MDILDEQVKAGEQAVIKKLQKIGLIDDAAMEGESARLLDAVDAFAKTMKARLLEKMLVGYSGWNDPKKVSSGSIRMAIYNDALDMDCGDIQRIVDIANRCMFLWYRDKEAA